MKNYPTLLLLVLLLMAGCKNNDTENIELSPSAEYPYTYTKLSTQEMAGKLQEFNAVNSYHSLTLDEFGMLRGNIPVDLSAGVDFLTVKTSILPVLKTYAPFLGITRSDTIHVETDFTIHLDGGVTVSLAAYFEQKLEGSPVFVLHQTKWRDRKMQDAQIAFYFSAAEQQMRISGRWYPWAFLPEKALKKQDDALNIAFQFINENHKEVLPLSLANVEKEEFKKVIFPSVSSRGIEMRECWEVIFWDNSVKTLVDTQTGEVVYYLQYGHMV